MEADIVDETQFHFGISFQNSWRVQEGDAIYVLDKLRVIRSKHDSVVYVDRWDGPRQNLKVYFIQK